MPTLRQQEWGQTAEAKPVTLFTLDNNRGMTVKITNYGGIITEIRVPDRNGHPGNVVLGFAHLGDYLKGHPFFGAIAGRVANRIARASFTLDGREYRLAPNNGSNHLHGGIRGFDKVVWQAKTLPDTGNQSAVHLSYLSKDGDEGYPGNLQATAVYALTNGNELSVEFSATTDKPTLVNLTNHSYFNLAGSGDVLGHELMLAAHRFTPVDNEMIPTGAIAEVKGTPLDFTTPRRIGECIAQLKPNPGGYDHNFVVDSRGKEFALAARVSEPQTGRVLEVHTTEPGVQLYTGNFLDGSLTSIGGLLCRQHAGFCLETQHFPDAVHHPNFPSVILRPGEVYRTKTAFRFSVER